MKTETDFFEEAAKVARQATCERAKCGSIIVSKNGEIIGKGFNAPVNNDENQRYCDVDLDLSIKPKYDKTCCVHAEWNAILDALKNNPQKINGGSLYFMRVDKNGNWTDSGEPYCTVCSRLAAQSGLAKFYLWSDRKPKGYNTDDYNIQSYNYYKR